MDDASPTSNSPSLTPPPPTGREEQRPENKDRSDARELWLDGGAKVLAEQGPEGLRLHGLARRVGRTTGSFYHHFSGMEQFRRALAEDFSGPSLRDAQEKAAHDDPVEELTRFLRIHQQRQVDDLASAMRAWARSFPPAAQAVERAERALLEYFEQIFRRLGSPRATARAQARLLCSLGIAQPSTPWRRSPAEERRALEIVLAASG